jgi:hypothetical protein
MRAGTSVGGRLRAVLDALTERLRICDGPGLDRRQRIFLLRDFREDLADQVDDAEHGASARRAPPASRPAAR